MDERSRLRQFEEQFLRQLHARAQVLVRRGGPADRFVLETVPDGIDAVRATLIRLKASDRELLEQLPGTRAEQYRFERRVLGPLHTTVARLRVQVLVPIEALVAGQPPGPIGREQVLDALARYPGLRESERPTAVAYASATGFTAEARALVHRPGLPALILLGARPDGGWDTEMPETIRRSGWAGLFELESQDEQLKRLFHHLEKNVAQLESRGIPLAELSEALGLSAGQTEALLRRACRQDSRLLTVVHEGTIHICRSPLAYEGGTMSLWSRIRKLLGFKPTVAERVRELTAQRVRLEQERHELDQRLRALEDEERATVEQGAAAKTDVERRQLAARLVRTRRELGRLRAQVNVVTQQIDILGTHIHHQTLAEKGKRVPLPKAEELTREAAEAEQVLAELAANADLAASIEVGAQTPLMAEEEAAILEEFKQAAAQQVAQSGAEPARTPAQQAPVPPETTPPGREKAGPEV